MGGVLERRPGRPLLLSEQVERRLCDAVRIGAPVAIAAQHAGVSESAVYLWCQRGREEIEARDAGQEPDPDLDSHVQLWERIVEARAQAALKNIALVNKAATGGYVTRETTRKFRDPETGRIVTETTVDRAPVDWRAASWWLERQQKAHFGKGADQVELTGSGGGPLQVETSVDVSALVARLHENMSGDHPEPVDIDTDA